MITKKKNAFWSDPLFYLCSTDETRCCPCGIMTLKLENGSFAKSDNFDATDLRFQSEGYVTVKAHWHYEEIVVQKRTVRGTNS